VSTDASSFETDLLVIGGGVHGCAIARDAAARGLSVVLVEKEDFGWGTSSRSSKLAHGGLRYLEHFQLGLVKESLHERDILLTVAPHLSWPLPFLIPLSGPAPRAGWMVRVGLTLYDLLAGRESLARHRVVRRREALEAVPALAKSGLRTAAEYHDAGMDDLRLVVELAIDAAELGATCLPHVKCRGLIRERGRVAGARLVHADGTRSEVRSRTTVLACGPWTNSVAGPHADGGERLLLTKGIHVFVRRDLVRSAALFLATPADGRVFFLIPWKGGTLVGTTDTPFRGAPDRVRPTAEDLRYLLAAVNGLLPGAKLERAELITAQAGLRPLVLEGDPDDAADSVGAVSRDWQLDADEPGLLVVEGGKYTIFRKLAEAVVDRASAPIARPLTACSTRTRPLPGAAGVRNFERYRLRETRRLARLGLAEESARHLVGLLGVRAKRVVAAAAGEKALLRPACDEHPHVPAQALHALTSELATTPADVLLRRLDLPWWDCGGLRCRTAWERAFRAAGLSKKAIHEGLAAHEAELARNWRP
jgi:glycerol-3-phosphate dehydrogenase